MPALIDATASLNVDAALSLIESLEEGGRIHFALLDERLEKLYAEADVTEVAGQVELLTMHGAKGLQWDMVVLPGLGRRGAVANAPLLAFSEVPVAGGAVPLMAAKASTRQKDALYSLVNGIEKSKDNNELQRLLYVACTRPETSLHMLAHVSEGKAEAANGSLLQLLFSHDEHCFGAQLWHIEAAGEPSHASRVSLQRISCLPGGLPTLPEENSEQETEYIWAGPEAAPVGNALHAALQHVAQIGMEQWHDELTQAEFKRMSRMLIGEGLSGLMLEDASARCTNGLKRVLSSEKGQWILSHRHQQAHCEWALSSEHDNHISHHMIDRSFIDAEGIRWIIDYKTASHIGGGLDIFLADEERRHAPQLKHYAGILKSMEPEREIRTALYFPMLDAWKEVTI